jgi:hypothetical protein
MAKTKCLKCGAEIPEGTNFCPSCGAASQAKQSQQMQARPPQPMPGGMGMGGVLDTLFSKMFIYLGILLGILFAWIGNIIVLFTTGTVANVGVVLNSLGFVSLGSFMLMGGLTNKKFDKSVRLGMLVGGAVIITLSLAIRTTAINF